MLRLVYDLALNFPPNNPSLNFNRIFPAEQICAKDKILTSRLAGELLFDFSLSFLCLCCLFSIALLSAKYRFDLP